VPLGVRQRIFEDTLQVKDLAKLARPALGKSSAQVASNEVAISSDGTLLLVAAFTSIRSLLSALRTPANFLLVWMMYIAIRVACTNPTD
jgi:hypothetical protein